MSAKLNSGVYIISSLSNNDYVGRNLAEDLSLLPKRVVILPQGIQAPNWIIESLPNGRYTLKIGGNATGAIDDLVFALLLENIAPEEWNITPVPQSGNNVYLIENKSREAGWVNQDQGPYIQVACRPLIVGTSEPPVYPRTQLWTIIPVPVE